MMHHLTAHRAMRSAVGGMAALTLMGVAGCEDTRTNEATPFDDGEDYGYTGIYDAGFFEDLDSLDGETVSITGAVDEIVSGEAFTMAATDDGTVEELLIVSGEANTDIAPDDEVTVTGTVHEEFVLAPGEEELATLSDDGLREDFEGEPYIEATDVDVSGTNEG